MCKRINTNYPRGDISTSSTAGITASLIAKKIIINNESYKIQDDPKHRR